MTCVRNCVVVAEERPRINLTTAFSTLFSGLGLSPRAVSTSFGCRANVAICTQVMNIGVVFRQSTLGRKRWRLVHSLIILSARKPSSTLIKTHRRV